MSDSQNEFHTYGIEWTESQITWSIDGTAVRTLVADEADGQYPQTPCQLRIGAWSGGDPSNTEGVIQWAGGATVSRIRSIMSRLRSQSPSASEKLRWYKY